MNSIKKYSFNIFLVLSLICGLLIFLPYANFQDYLAQGDHGRDLYAAQAVLRGEMPYKDFWWVYGPLMPYYYALFFKIFGVQITSVLLGKMLLNMACGHLFFLAVSQMAPPAAAFAASLWFMCFQPDFFFTYNHIGGIVLILAVVWMHFSYLRYRRPVRAYMSLVFVFLLGLVKINFGLVALLMTMLTIRGTKRLFYTMAWVMPVAWLAIYFWLTHGLSIAEIRQCFPYLKGDEPYNHFSMLQTLPMLYNRCLGILRDNSVLYPAVLLICVCLIKNILLRDGLFLIGYTVLFSMLNLNEYLPSGVWYRTFWAEPLGILLCAIIIITGIKKSPQILKAAVWTFFFVLCLLNTYHKFQEIKAFKTPSHFLDLPKTKVYIKNPPQWIATVKQTTRFLKRTLTKDEVFFALPYDCLYYYLTGKPSPTRQLIVFQHIHISPAQEQKIIKDLKNKNVRMILISSRESTTEEGHGIFGKTYCHVLYRFIKENYSSVVRFGEWIKPSGWINNHGTVILQRKN